MHYITVLNLQEYIKYTTLYWSFLNTCTLLHCIEASSVNTLLQCIENSRVHPHHFTVWNLVENWFLTSFNWILLCTSTSLHWNKSFWLHIIYIIVLNHLEFIHLILIYWRFFKNRYCTSQNQICLTTYYILHNYIKAYWLHIRHFT